MFSILNGNSGYGKIEIHQCNVDKTVLTSYHGLYRFPKIPFEVKNASATLQIAADVVLASVRWQVFLVYLVDTVVFLKLLLDDFEQVRRVLQFFYIEFSTNAVEKVKNLTTQRQLRSFPGL